MRAALSAICLFLSLCAEAFAQPAAASRVLRRFDFEERKFNVEALPMDWQKVEGPGLPHYVNGKLSRQEARGGEYSFQFDLNGGSLVYRYPAGKIAARVGGHYRVEAWAKTTPLRYARARVTAYFADVDMRPLIPTVRHSNLYAASGAGEAWHRLEVELTASDEKAAFLVIELSAVQPTLQKGSTLGSHALYMQDIRGTLWFDDLSVSQVPRVTMSTDRPGNVFPAGVPISVHIEVNDRFTDDLSAQLVIRDADGKTVHSDSRALDLTDAKSPGDGVRSLTVALPTLPVGCYHVGVAMSSQGESLGEQRLAIVRLADSGLPVPADDRLGVIATQLPYEAWRELPDLLTLLGVGRVKLAVWTERGDVTQIADAGFDSLLEELRRRNITPTACLTGLPPAIAARVGGKDWANLLKAPDDAWQPRLAYMIARHANHLDRWQLGEDGTDEFVTNPLMRRVYDRFHTEFTRLMQTPDLAMPWPAWYELEDSAPQSIALSLPASVLPAQVPLYVADSPGLGRAGDERLINASATGSMNAPQRILSLSLQPLDRERYGREAQIRDLAQRYAHAVAAGARRIDLPLPFEARLVGDEIVREPQELLLIIRTLNMLLGNSTFKGRVPIAENIEAFLFDRNGQGVLMLWSRGNEPGVKELAINLGSRPMCVDLWGNVTPLLTGDRRRQSARLQVGPMPIFLLDIDGEMAQLRSSVAWSNDKIESSFKPHVRKLRFTNPYRTGLSGQIRLRGPAGWSLSPPALQFSLNPGETLDRDVIIEFPYNSFAGTKPVEVEFMLQSPVDETFAVPAPFQLGLGDIGLQTIALLDGPDLLVQQQITNYGEKPIDYTAFAILPGQARQERLVTNLGPGRSTIKKYRFPNVPSSGTFRVRSGMKELDGTRILNDEVEVR